MSGPAPDSAHTTFGDLAFTAAQDAYVRESDSWEAAVQSALAGLFAFLAANSHGTRTCLVDRMHGDVSSLAKRDELLVRFAAFLEPGYAASPHPPPVVVAEAISGGIYELIRTYAVEGRLEDLPAALPAASTLALTPFVGSEEAKRRAASHTFSRAER